MDRYEDDQHSGKVITKTTGAIKEYQKVIAVGTTVKGINEGDWVLIDPTRYGHKKHQEGSLKDGVITDNPIVSYSFPTLDVNGVEHLLLYDSDVTLVLEDFEDKQENIILPETPKVIV